MQPAVSGSQARSLNLAMFCHVLAFAGYVIPMGHIVGPLVLWLVKRHSDAAVDAHGKEVLNFQISITIYSIVAFVAVMLVAFTLQVGFILVVLAMLGVMVFDIVFTVRGAVAASRGQSYRYPLSIRMIR